MKNLLRRLRSVWYPDRYHGWGKNSRYFEGWYFKIVDPTEQYAFAVIPGIAIDPQGKKQVFIQRLDGKAGTAAFHEFDAAAFQPEADRFAVRIAGNQFTANELQLELPELRGKLQFDNLYPWPKMLGAPGIMGWYSFVPFMECYHGVVSVDHSIRGELEVYGEQVDFTGGRGYIEKDWGQSFPSSWIWMQTNHFGGDQRVSLMASVANIPWLGSHFVGCIVGFLLEDRLYRFATYTGAKMKVAIRDHGVDLVFSDRKYRLEIQAEQGHTGALVSPISGVMTGKVNESMQAKVNVKFYENGNLRYEGTGKNAGLELAGAVETLAG